MKKTINVLAISALLIGNACAADNMVLASAAGAKSKAILVNQASPKASEKGQSGDYALESFSCCGLPQ